MNTQVRMLNFKYFLLQALFWGAAVINYAYMTQILEGKGFSEVEIGILNGVKLLVGIIFQVWIGAFLDKHVYTVPLKRIIALLAFASAALTFALCFTGHHFAVMLLISVGFGITFTTMSPLIDSLSMLYVNHGENVNYAKGRAGGSLAWAILCLASGWYCDYVGLGSFPLWGVAFLIILGIAAETMPWKMINKQHISSTQKLMKSHQPHTVWYLLVHFPAYTLFLLGSAIMFMGYNFGCTFLIDVMTGLGGSNADFGISQFVLAISELPSVFIVLHLRRKIQIKWMMLCCSFFMTLKNVITFYAVNTQWIIGAQLCEMLGFGLFYAAGIYYIAQLLPEEDIVKGTTLLSVATVGLGEGIASMLCGIIRRHIGLYGLLGTAAFTSMFSIFVMFYMCRIMRKNKIGVDPSTVL